MAKAIVVLFTAFIIMALFNLCGDLFMRVRLTKRELPSDKLLWWRRGGDDVADAYQELFPHSNIPRFRVLTFWLFLGLALIGAILVAWKRG